MNTTEMRIPSNRVRDVRRYSHEQLDGLYGSGEVESMMRMLFEAFLGWDTTQLLLHNGDTINQSDLLRFHWAIEDLKRYRPIQHIIGYVDFCGCRIHVSPAALVPRPETEQLVETAVSTIQRMGEPHPRVIDLCTGSGCIAIAIAKAVPAAQITAVELSEEAMGEAKANAVYNQANVEFVHADILDIQGLCPKLGPNRADLIVSNPPYVCQSGRKEMRPNVLDYDPAMALFVADETPLLFYHAIAEIGDRCLKAGGILAVEINEKLGAETAALFASHGYQCSICQDFRERDRFVVGRKV